MSLWRRRWGAVASLLVLSGCGGGQDVTPGALSAAKALWKKSDIRDYDLEWKSSGAMSGQYRVFVRGGRVRLIYTVTPDDKEIVAKPGTPQMYGVDGLFKIIEEEYRELDAERPFGRPRSPKYVLKFSPDSKLGYPQSYQRDFVGSPKGLVITVIRLVTNPGPIPGE
jgi:hypothetical protein